MHYTIAGWQIALLWLVPALLYAILSRPTKSASQLAIFVQRLTFGGFCAVIYAWTLISLSFAVIQRFQLGDWVAYQDADYFALGNLLANFMIVAAGIVFLLFWGYAQTDPVSAKTYNRSWEKLPINCLKAFFVVGYITCGPLLLMLRIGEIKKKEEKPLPAWVDPMDRKSSRPFVASSTPARLATA